MWHKLSRTLAIDYGAARTGIAITDPLGITAQGLETINSNGSDKVILRRLEELLNEYDIDTFVLGNPLNMDGSKSTRTEETEKFMHKLKCRFNKINIVQVDERLTTVEAHKTMNYLDIKATKKRGIVDTIAAVYILESYMNKKAWFLMVYGVK